MIPGFIISIVTFPGVIVHEYAHKLFCELTGTKVLEVCYFRFGNPAGYVVHEPPTNVWKHIVIGIGPFAVNSVIGFFIGLVTSEKIFHSGSPEIVKVFLAWLPVSIAMHSFPSTGDANCIWSAVWQKGSPITARVVGTPLVGIIFLGAIGSFFWLDLLYGVAVAGWLPKLIMG